MRRHGPTRCTECAQRSARKWKAEAGGLAWMIIDISTRYVEAKESMGGDSELLCSSITQSARYVTEGLRPRYEAGL